MARRNEEEENIIKIRRQKPRVKIPINTDTIIHKPDKAYTRKAKHKRCWAEEDEEE